jgi:hypothetical protein
MEKNFDECNAHEDSFKLKGGLFNISHKDTTDGMELEGAILASWKRGEGKSKMDD